MANPFSGWVIASAVVLSSPALWAALVDGSMSLQTAMVRLGVALALAWLGLSMLGALVGEPPEPASSEGEKAKPAAIPAVPVSPAGGAVPTAAPTSPTPTSPTPTSPSRSASPAAGAAPESSSG